jgi:hypothetical protein
MDPTFADNLTAKQQSVMRYWGQLDGKTGERLASLLLEVIAGADRRSRAI